ncbi:MAG: sulfite exporter TauE/SafE family protein [Pseudomonadota bacterium]
MVELIGQDFWVLVVGALAALVAGVSKAGFGSGVVAVATPMLALVADPMVAVGAMLPVLMAIDLAALRAYWRKWSWSEARKLILASVPGIAVGAGLHAVTDPDVFRILIGTLALAFVAYQAAKAQGWTTKGGTMGGGWGYVFGGVAGFTSFVSHSGGPPLLIYLLGRSLGKVEFQATTVIVFWAINILKFPPYIALGFYSGGAVALIFWLLPFAMLGVWIGLWANRTLSDRAFFMVSYVFLVLAGGKLIYDGIF